MSQYYHEGPISCNITICLSNPMVRPDDGFFYHEYFLIYVDDVMVIHHDA